MLSPLRFGAMLLAVLCTVGCERAGTEKEELVELRLSSGGQVKTLDPILADDAPSRNLAAALFDTLLEYDYLARPYRLRPSMLRAMPEVSADGKRWTFALRPDLLFAADPCFDGVSRQVTARDVIFSFLRLADARNHSPVYWTIRGKIEGVDAFREASLHAKVGDFSLYDRGVAGLRALDETTLELTLTAPDPRFEYTLALPWLGVVSRRAAEYYAEREPLRPPVGSGPFVVAEFQRDYQLILERNPAFRHELFPGAASEADRTRPLPLAGRIVCPIVKQPMAAWLLFLQGNFDLAALDKDTQEIAEGKLPPALEQRGMELIRIPEFEIRYVGFNLADPILKDRRVRQAIALAYDLRRREEFYSFQMLPAAGPIPPGVAGFRAAPVLRVDLARAAKLLTEAGYPGGRDPKTGEPLTLTFDQAGSTPQHRQLGELAAADLARIGIRVLPVLNSRPRFVEKLRQGQTQLFRYSWVGDYPDAENFLQLFYSGNRGSNNYAGYANAEFDRAYEALRALPDGPERNALCEKMVDRVAADSPWIFEGFPVSSLVRHAWLENYHVHDFAFNRWKYLTVDPARRAEMCRTFTPLRFEDLR